MITNQNGKPVEETDLFASWSGNPLTLPVFNPLTLPAFNTLLNG